MYNRYAEDVAKIYDTKIALFQEYLENYDSMSGEQAESYLRRRAAVEEDIMQFGSNTCRSFARCLREGKQRSFSRSTGDSIS